MKPLLSLALCLSACALLHAQGAQAVPPPNPALGAAAVQQGNRQTSQFERQQRRLHSAANPANPEIAGAAAKPAPTPAAPGPSFLLRRLVTTPSAILTPAQIDSVTRQYRNRRVTLADLQHAVAQINALYARQGIITARAVLPPQRVVGGVVRIQLIEARLDRVAVVGAHDTAPAFYLNRVHARPGQLLLLNPLRRDLILMNSGADVQVRALLAPGRAFGTTDLVLQVQEPPRYALLPSFDNIGRASIGLQRLGLTADDTSLFGDRDALSLNASWATGTFSQTASYNIPLTRGGAALNLGEAFSGIRVRSGQLRTLGVTGNSVEMTMGISQPLAVRQGFVLTGSSSFDLIRSATRSSGFPVSRQIVQAGDFGANLQWFDGQGAWIASDRLTFGTVNQTGMHVFGLDALSLVRQERMGGGTMGIVRLSGQAPFFHPPAGLPLVEQLQLGGIASVRGYPEGWQIGNAGYALTTEFDAPLPLRRYFFGGSFSRGLEGAVFMDNGGMFGLPGPRTGPGAVPRDLYLTSVGMGVVFNIPYFTGRLDWAAPLENRAGLPKVGFDFYLQPRVPMSWLGLGPPKEH
jgi:hemolysin activation/secretion protein